VQQDGAQRSLIPDAYQFLELHLCLDSTSVKHVVWGTGRNSHPLGGGRSSSGCQAWPPASVRFRDNRTEQTGIGTLRWSQRNQVSSGSYNGAKQAALPD